MADSAACRSIGPPSAMSNGDIDSLFYFHKPPSVTKRDFRRIVRSLPADDVKELQEPLSIAYSNSLQSAVSPRERREQAIAGVEVQSLWEEFRDRLDWSREEFAEAVQDAPPDDKAEILMPPQKLPTAPTAEGAEQARKSSVNSLRRSFRRLLKGKPYQSKSAIRQQRYDKAAVPSGALAGLPLHLKASLLRGRVYGFIQRHPSSTQRTTLSTPQRDRLQKDVYRFARDIGFRRPTAQQFAVQALHQCSTSETTNTSAVGVNHRRDANASLNHVHVVGRTPRTNANSRKRKRERALDSEESSNLELRAATVESPSTTAVATVSHASRVGVILAPREAVDTHKLEGYAEYNKAKLQSSNHSKPVVSYGPEHICESSKPDVAGIVKISDIELTRAQKKRRKRALSRPSQTASTLYVQHDSSRGADRRERKRRKRDRKERETIKSEVASERRVRKDSNSEISKHTATLNDALLSSDILPASDSNQADHLRSSSAKPEEPNKYGKPEVDTHSHIAPYTNGDTRAARISQMRQQMRTEKRKQRRRKRRNIELDQQSGIKVIDSFTNSSMDAPAAALSASQTPHITVSGAHGLRTVLTLDEGDSSADGPSKDSCHTASRHTSLSSTEADLNIAEAQGMTGSSTEPKSLRRAGGPLVSSDRATLVRECPTSTPALPARPRGPSAFEASITVHHTEKSDQSDSDDNLSHHTLSNSPAAELGTRETRALDEIPSQGVDTEPRVERHILEGDTVVARTMDYEAHMQHAESSCKDIVSPTNVMTQSAPAPAMLSPIRNTHHTFAEFNAMLSGPGSDGNEEVHDADGIMEIIAVRTVDEDLRDLAGESASISDGHRNRQDRIRNNGVVVAGTTVGEINPEALEVIDRHALRPRSLAPQPREDVLKNNMLDEYQTYKHHIDQDPNIIAHTNKNHGADQLDGQLRMDDQDIINVVTVGPAKASQELLNDFHVEHQIGPRSESQESQNHREEADMQLKAEFAASQESTAMTPEARVRRPSPMVVVYDTPTVSRPGDEVDARPLFNYPAADEENRSLPSQHGDQDKPNVDSRDLHYTVGVCEPTMVALLDDSMKTSETGPTTPQKEKTGLSSDHFESPSSKKKRKQTTLKSPHFLDPATASKKSPLQKKGRIPAGTSCVHFPPLSAPRFGLIQEELADDPFRLLVAVTFLNKTKGEVAIPVYRALMSRYPTPADLARADPEEVAKTIHHLGLQNQRASSIIRLAATWESQPPEKSKRYRTLHYPTPGAGRELRDAHVLGDADERTGAWEVARMPGTGPYAWDSWRIFCRDRLRGLADDYKGTGAAEGFEPEWKRVVPKDKELRACLRWMWLREGWEWDPLTGNKKVASVELMKQATTGRGEWDNPDGMMGSAIKPTDKQGRPVDDTEPLPLSSTASPHRNGLADEEPALPAPRNLTETAETAKEAEAQDLNITSKEPVSQGLYREQSPIPSPQPNAVEAATKPEVLVNNTPLKESVSQEMDREQRAQSVAFLNSSVTRKRTKVYRTDSTPLKQDREGVATQSEQAEPHPNDVDDDDEALEDQSDGEADRAGQTAEPVSAIRSGRGSVLSSTRARSGEGASRRAVRQESDIAESNPHTEVAEQLAPHDTVDAGVETLLTQLRHAALGFEGDGVQAAPSGRVEDGADGEAEDEEAEEDEQSVEDTSEEEEEDEEGYGGREASMELL